MYVNDKKVIYYIISPREEEGPLLLCWSFSEGYHNETVLFQDEGNIYIGQDFDIYEAGPGMVGKKRASRGEISRES